MHANSLAPDERPSVAVLPFDPSEDAALLPIGAGLAADIITSLSHVPSLTVMARHSSFPLRDRAADTALVGRELGVRCVLQGSVGARGATLDVAAQLVDAASGALRWSGSYEVAREGIFVARDRIADAVVATLATAIPEGDLPQARRAHPASVDAWIACQQGLLHLTHATREGNEAATSFFRLAMSLDPQFPGSYIGLSAALGRSKGTQPEEEMLAAQAVSLDGRNAEARARLALALLARGDHARAEAEAREALSLCPGLADAHAALGMVLAYGGSPREGVASLRECLRLDPRGPWLVNRLNQVALALYLAGDFADAAEAAARAIAAFPTFPSPYRWKAAALGQLGRSAQARAVMAEAVLISPAEFEFQVERRPPWFRAVDHELMLDGLRKAGWQG